MSAPPRVSRIAQLALVTAQPDALATFFVVALDAQVVEERQEDETFALLLGLPGVGISRTILSVGRQKVSLLSFDKPGRAYPDQSTSSDLWFQHFAFIVSDMDEAYARLLRVGGFTPISLGGPQHLPPDAGAVTAFKFRDLEGHPLELLAFPPGQEPEAWRRTPDQSLVQGIDHSAISVANTDSSIAFFGRVFGLALGPRSLNSGSAQAAMDDVPDARVAVTALLPVTAPPHVELLGYEVGRRRPVDSATRSNDIAATIFCLETNDLAAVARAAEAAGARYISPGIVTLADGTQALMLLDPDGHRFMVSQPAF